MNRDCVMNHFDLAVPLLSILLPAVAAAEETAEASAARVTYEGIDGSYARAIARAVDAARAAARETFGLDMPATITIRVKGDPKECPRLFNDGNDRIVLTVRSDTDLQRPAQSGLFHLYGFCHEVGHLGMYRTVRNHGWLTTAAAEGWAHYLGSRLVDAVHAREGAALWPDRYNYIEDGMARLEAQIRASRSDPIVRGAMAWADLAKSVGDKGVQPVFKAWAESGIDPTDPAPAARKALLAAHPDKRLDVWWSGAEPLFIFARPKSGFAAQTAIPKDLAGTPIELSNDDGTPAGKRSLAGGGHAVRFKTAGPGWVLMSVSMYGSRYGAPQPPADTFHVWLCDAEFNPIADFPFPYARFARVEDKWVALSVPPTRVPPEFVVCVGFNPTASKGVFVHHDKDPSGNSFTGLPGEKGDPCRRGDWLIRVKVDQLKSANPLWRGRE
jgi:hypothetical protein